MSGGVDSSVSAHLLQSAGHEVIGVFMRHGETVEEVCSTSSAASGSLERSGASPFAILSPRSDHKQGCCSAADAADARRVGFGIGSDAAARTSGKAAKSE